MPLKFDKSLRWHLECCTFTMALGVWQAGVKLRGKEMAKRFPVMVWYSVSATMYIAENLSMLASHLISCEHWHAGVGIYARRGHGYRQPVVR